MSLLQKDPAAKQLLFLFSLNVLLFYIEVRCMATNKIRKSNDLVNEAWNTLIFSFFFISWTHFLQYLYSLSFSLIKTHTYIHTDANEQILSLLPFLPPSLSVSMVSEEEDLQFPAGPAACAERLLCSVVPCYTQLYEPFPHRLRQNIWMSGSSAGTLLSKEKEKKFTQI